MAKKSIEEMQRIRWNAEQKSQLAEEFVKVEARASREGLVLSEAEKMRRAQLVLEKSYRREIQGRHQFTWLYAMLPQRRKLLENHPAEFYSIVPVEAKEEPSHLMEATEPTDREMLLLNHAMMERILKNQEALTQLQLDKYTNPSDIGDSAPLPAVVADALSVLTYRPTVALIGVKESHVALLKKEFGSLLNLYIVTSGKGHGNVRGESKLPKADMLLSTRHLSAEGEKIAKERTGQNSIHCNGMAAFRNNLRGMLTKK